MKLHASFLWFVLTIRWVKILVYSFVVRWKLLHTMTFLSGAAVLLLRGLVISAVLGLESSYTSQLSNRVTPDPAAVAPTGKTFVSQHTASLTLTNLHLSLWRGHFSNKRYGEMLDRHCCFDEGMLTCDSVSLAPLLDDSGEFNPLPDRLWKWWRSGQHPHGIPAAPPINAWHERAGGNPAVSRAAPPWGETTRWGFPWPLADKMPP